MVIPLPAAVSSGRPLAFSGSVRNLIVLHLLEPCGLAIEAHEPDFPSAGAVEHEQLQLWVVAQGVRPANSTRPGWAHLQNVGPCGRTRWRPLACDRSPSC